jgi:fluoroacetyl-CoA thioesterase
VKPTLQPGLTTSLEYRVPMERTAPHLLPESAAFAALPRVLATGHLVGIVEWACMCAVNGHLEAGEQTLGIHVDLSHVAPTPPGGVLAVHVELAQVTDRQLTFAVEATDEVAVVCRGVHRRAVIDRDRFERRLATRTTSEDRSA